MEYCSFACGQDHCLFTLWLEIGCCGLPVWLKRRVLTAYVKSRPNLQLCSYISYFNDGFLPFWFLRNEHIWFPTTLSSWSFLQNYIIIKASQCLFINTSVKALLYRPSVDLYSHVSFIISVDREREPYTIMPNDYV